MHWRWWAMMKNVILVMVETDAERVVVERKSLTFISGPAIL